MFSQIINVFFVVQREEQKQVVPEVTGDKKILPYVLPPVFAQLGTVIQVTQ